MAEDQEALHRFHRTLVRELRSRDRWDPSEPLTVAEIYRDLIPHPTHAEELGVETRTDYEIVLLRFLTGEGDYLTMESHTASQEIRNELDAPTPDTGLYRDFAKVEVRLNPNGSWT